MGIFDRALSLFESELDKRLGDSLQKSSSDVGEEILEKKMKADGHGRKGLMFDPFTDQGYAGGMFKPKGASGGLVSNIVLKVVARRDPIVSTILNVRANQVSAFCRRQADRFETGFKVQLKKDRPAEDLNDDEVKEIEEFVINCGKKTDRSEEDKMTFDQFGHMIAKDMLTYGHTAIELVRDMGGDLHSFLPLPAETIYFANKKLYDKEMVQQSINSFREAAAGSFRDQKDINEEPAQLKDYEYLQVVNGKVVEGFTREELLMARIYLQTDIDLNGYSISPLERALMMITAHLQIENHQKMFFTHGVASKGLLVIQGDVTPNQLRTLQSQWTSQVTGPNAAWRTPILAGIQGVQWQQLTPSTRDMEYAAYQDHVIRTIHACFTIDPEETGFGYLSKGVEQKSLSESSNEWKVTASRDRGLRPILARIEAILNEQILPAWSKDYADKYDICFVGLDAESQEEEIQRLQAEVQLHTTINEARKEADRDELEIGGGLILNPLLLATLQANMPKGVFMETFMGIKGASERPDLQYVPDQFWFQWQQMQMGIMQQQAQAQQSLEEEPPEKGKKEPKDPEKRKQKRIDDEHADAMESHEEQQAQAQAQAAAMDQFIAANPEIFKSMRENLKKSHFHDDHVDHMRDGLVKDFDRASQFLVKEIMKAVEEDISDRDEPSEPPKEEDESHRRGRTPPKR